MWLDFSKKFMQKNDSQFLGKEILLYIGMTICKTKETTNSSVQKISFLHKEADHLQIQESSNSSIKRFPFFVCSELSMRKPY